MREMTLSYFKANNRTVVTYRTEEGKIQVPYRDTKPKAAEQRFRREYGLRYKHIKRTYFEH